MLTFSEFFKSGEIVNLTEQIVYDELKVFIDNQEYEFCQCDKCLFDIVCVLLNSVPSLYSSSVVDRASPSEEFAAEYEQLRKLVKGEVPRAIERVKGRLHH